MILLGLLVIMTAADGLLIHQNLQMRRLLPRPTSQLTPGSKLPAFSGKTIDDQPIAVNYNGTGPKYIYFYFTASCRFCRQQFPLWKKILRESSSHNLQAFGLVKDTENRQELRRYLEEMGCSSNSANPLNVAFISDSLRNTYGLSATPVTLLTDNRGLLEKSWVGAWTEAERAEAESVLQFSISP